MYDASMHVDHRSPMPSVETQKAYRSAAMRDLKFLNRFGGSSV
jgi:hypothetical protein